jgi:hypothetical protein
VQTSHQHHRRSLRAADAAVPIGLGQWGQEASNKDQQALAQMLGGSSSGGGTAAAAAVPSPAPIKISDLLNSGLGRKLLAAADVPAGLAEWLRTATPEQKQQLALLGFDEATLQTATPQQLQQLAQKLGLPDLTSGPRPTLQQVAGLRRLQEAADTPPGLAEYAKTASSTVQDDLLKLGFGAAKEEHPPLTLLEVTDAKNAASAATTSDPHSATTFAAASTTAATAAATASTVPNATMPLRRKLAAAAHPLLRSLPGAQH